MRSLTSRTRVALAIIAVGALLAAACGDDSDSPGSAPSGAGANAKGETARAPEFAEDLSPFRLRPGFGPVAYLATDGLTHLDYELYLDNRRPDPRNEDAR